MQDYFNLTITEMNQFKDLALKILHNTKCAHLQIDKIPTEEDIDISPWQLHLGDYRPKIILEEHDDIRSFKIK